MCWGAFGAVQDFGTSAPSGTSTVSYLGLCPLPPKTTRLELIKAYLMYLDAHPEHGGLRFNTIVIQDEESLSV
jgi:hypothetical protein